jgi:small subunit ribosomal protein S16
LRDKFLITVYQLNLSKMPAKIRLQRHGRKRYAYYHIVIADSRAPRDGSNVERIGSYNPNTNPATIDLDFDKALTWLNNGAQPTDTVRAILSYKGVLYKKHLLGGVAKGAFTAEEAETRFEAWMTEKANKIQAKKEGLLTNIESSQKAQFDMEAKKNAERVQTIAKRNADAAAAARAAATPAPVAEEVAKEVAPEETEG